MNNENWIQVGEIGVDAGLVWVGDPCYCVTPDANNHPAKTWSEFCDLYKGHADQIAKQFNYSAGHEGLGVTVQSGYGDGIYPVLIRKNAEGRVMEVKVVFIDESEDEEEDEDE